MNHLADALSTYLLQHAGEPVDWRPWGDEAFAQARTLKRPLLLSIGYAACHWCHVMAHESFEDPEVARLLNDGFVCVKVDREEHPDVDAFFQTAHQLLTGRGGGWPLTVFLTPEGAPFFSGTYFPKKPRYGLAGFVDLLQAILRAFEEKNEAVYQQGQAVLSHLNTIFSPSPGKAPPFAVFKEALAKAFDDEAGGLQGAPKFPQAPLWLAALLSGEKDLGDKALFSLSAMAQSGLFDHLGGGFFRYAVDDTWTIPHFEKMLADNALFPQLLACGVFLGKSGFAQPLKRTLSWLFREMAAKEGGFCTSLDADTQGVEGGTYTWEKEELVSILDPKGEPRQWELFSSIFGLAENPNFEGRWHLKMARTPISFQERRLLLQAEKKLFLHRRQRPLPLRDEKVITGLNALLAQSLMASGLWLGRRVWFEEGRKLLAFIKECLWEKEGLVHHRFLGKSGGTGFIDDIAYTLFALLTSFAQNIEKEDLAFAQDLAELALRAYARAEGGFFLGPPGESSGFPRICQGACDATPSGNAVLGLALAELGVILGESRYLEAAEGVLSAFANEAKRAPLAYPAYFLFAKRWQEGMPMVVLTGPDEEVRLLRARIWQTQGPHARLVVSSGKGLGNLGKPSGPRALGWVCGLSGCSAPQKSADEVTSTLKKWMYNDTHQ